MLYFNVIGTVRNLKEKWILKTKLNIINLILLS